MQSESTIEPETLTQRIDIEPILVVDVRSRMMFREGAIPGAINVPFGPHFGDRLLDACPDDTTLVVLYGRAAEEGRAEMTDHSDVEVQILAGGIEGWRDAGGDVHVSPLRLSEEWRQGVT